MDEDVEGRLYIFEDTCNDLSMMRVLFGVLAVRSTCMVGGG